MTLENYGFQSGRITLPGIEMPAELARGFYFRNYGEVQDINERIMQMMQEINVKDKLSVLRSREESKRLAGFHVGIRKMGGDIGSALFFKEGLDEENKAFIYGHESVHALMNLGLEDQFLKFLRNEGFNINPFEIYHDDEKIADFGGVLALYKHDLFSASHSDINPIKEVLMSGRR